jgi:D-alanine-D-alanine ligase
MKRILVLFDAAEPTAVDHDFSEELKDKDEYETEADVVRSLKRLGHETRLLALYDSLTPLMQVVDEWKPDLVFNLMVAFRLDRVHEPHIAGALELMGVPYTGANPTALTLCKDKALAKKILDFHRIKTPRFLVSARARPLRHLTKIKFPVIAKPLSAEGSEGIALAALCEDEKSALERVAFLHQSQETDVLVEEFIDGRELYAGVLGKERLQVLPPVELFVGHAPIGAEETPEGAPRFFTFKAKWDRAYRKKWGISSGAAKELPDPVLKKIGEVTRRVCRVLRIRSHGRLDLRLTAQNDVYVIEANPNPSLAASDELAMAAKLAGIDYDTLIARIVQYAGG